MNLMPLFSGSLRCRVEAARDTCGNRRSVRGSRAELERGRLLVADRRLGDVGDGFALEDCAEHQRLRFADMNGDGLLDIVVGDLIGKMTVALREPGDGPPKFAAETKLMALDGKELDFANW